MEPPKHLVEPFYFPGSRVGCLLVHGFSGSTSEMRLMGEELAKLGWSVLGIQLSGHGTTPEDMAKTCWEDWAKDAEDGVNELRKTCDTVIGIGLSMGGLLVLHLAALHLIDGLVAMNAPMVLADRKTRFVGLIRPFTKYVNKPGSGPKAPTLKPDLKLERFVYDRIPVDALMSLNRGMRQVRGKLHVINCPALLMQSTGDLTVAPVSIEIIKKKIRLVNPVSCYWEKSGHISTLGQERGEVIKKIHEFLEGFSD